MESQPVVNPPGPHDEAVAWLSALAAELEAYGWSASLQAKRGGAPSLHARNPVPGAGALSEHIHARPDAEGNWAFWWPWGDVIAHAPDDAAWIIVSAHYWHALARYACAQPPPEEREEVPMTPDP